MSKKISNVTAKIVSECANLDKTMSAAFLRLLMTQGFASESGLRKNVKADGAQYVILRGRPSVTFDLDMEAVSAALGSTVANKIADRAARDAAEYSRQIAHAEALATAKRVAAAKAAKVDRLTAALAKVREGGTTDPTDPATVF